MPTKSSIAPPPGFFDLPTTLQDTYFATTQHERNELGAAYLLRLYLVPNHYLSVTA